MRILRNRQMTWEPSLQTSSFKTQNMWPCFLPCWRYWAISAPLAEDLCYRVYMNCCLKCLCIFVTFRSSTSMYVGLVWNCWLLSWKTRVSRSKVSFWSVLWVSVSSQHLIKLVLHCQEFTQDLGQTTIKPKRPRISVCYLARASLTCTNTIFVSGQMKVVITSISNPRNSQCSHRHVHVKEAGLNFLTTHKHG